MFSRLFNFNKKKSNTQSPKIGEKLSPNVGSWTIKHLEIWLQQNELDEYSDAFVKNAISGSELLELSEKDLEHIGVKKLGSRKKLMKLIADGCIKRSDRESIGSPMIALAHSPLPDSDELSDTSSLSKRSSELGGIMPAPIPNLPEHLDQKYLLFEDLPDGVIVMNTEKTIMFMNKSAEKIFLFPRGDLLGCNIKVLMPEPHRSRHDSYVDKYLNGGKGSVIGKGRMVEAKAKDNSLVPIWLSVTESVDDTNNEKIFIGTFKDLRNVNPASRSTQNKMLMLLDNLVDSAIVMDTSSQIIFFNKSAETLFGFSKEEALGKPVEMLMPSEVAKNHKQFVENYMRTKQGKVIGKGRNVEVLKKDGTRQTVFFSLTETKWGEGNSTAFCATLQPLNELVDAKKSAGNQVKKVEEVQKLDSNDPMTRLLQEVIDNVQARAALKQYLVQSQNVEPLLFIEAIDEYLILKSNFYRFTTAQVIYESFVKHGGKYELNLPSSVKQELLSQFVEKKISNKHCPSNIFNRAYEVVLADLKVDAFSRFKSSDAFKQIQGNESWFSKQQQA